MSVIDIREAQRQGARLLIGLAGTSGSGKTYSALRLAYGLAGGDSKKIGFLDTENRRGSLYADKLPNKEKFLIADLIPPFSPERYIEAVKAFQQRGIEVLIVDSITHEWSGEGGCCEIAEQNKLGGLPNWAKAKGQHKRLVNALLYSDMHIIVCVRAQEKAKPEKIIENGKEKTIYVPIGDGVEPVCEKNFMFEMTASVVMEDMGTRQRVKKCPADLMPHLGRGAGYLTEDDGRAIRQWVDGADPLNPEIERIRHLLETTCERGMDALKAAWEATPGTTRNALGKAFLETLKASAAEYDRQREEPRPDAASDNNFTQGGERSDG